MDIVWSAIDGRVLLLLILAGLIWATGWILRQPLPPTDDEEAS